MPRAVFPAAMRGGARTDEAETRQGNVPAVRFQGFARPSLRGRGAPARSGARVPSAFSLPRPFHAADWMEPASGNAACGTMIQAHWLLRQESLMKNINDIVADVTEPPETFEEYLTLYANQVGDLVNGYLPSGTHPDMDRYLYDPLKKYSENGGKRHRPLICFAACRAVGGDMRLATCAAAAIEHFHTAALIHDDIADEAELRRGEPCMHLTEGIGLAINAGDLALSLVNGTVVEDSDLDDPTKVRVIGELINMTRRTIEGQALDIGWARDGRYDITPEDYLVMATHKTAHYSGAVPLAVGAIIGGGTEAEIEALRNYGLDTGLAFQIQDDLLNLVGSEESTKKDFRNDITEGKRTLMVVHALTNANGAARDRLIAILSAKEKDPAVLAEAVEIMQAAGSIDYARSYAENLTSIAKNRLIDMVKPSTSRDLLASMADWFVNRLK